MLKYHNTVFFTNVKNGYYNDVLLQEHNDKEQTKKLINEMVNEITTQFGLSIQDAIQLISILKFKTNLEMLWK
jgi:hypothetical protein